MKDWIKGMDVSSLLEVEHCGGEFYDCGDKKDALKILRGYGMNLIRLRLWNDPYAENGNSYGAGGNDWETVKILAKRGKAAGASWLLDFHYSDFWADPGKQFPPKTWKGLGLEELIEKVYTYTRDILNLCKEENILPQIVAVGNELSNGLLWPYGKVPNYENITRLVSAGIRAVRETDSGIEVMLHLDNGGNNALYRTWFDEYLRHGGEDFDYIGLSYYPFWHGTMEMLRSNMNDLALRYHKKLLLAEVSMGYTTEDYGNYEHLLPNERKGMATKPALTENLAYPMTVQGQGDFMREIMEIIRDIPEGLGRGFCYWEPAWIPVPGSGWAAEAGWDYVGETGPGGNEWANQALFDYEGNALPTLQVIRDFQP